MSARKGTPVRPYTLILLLSVVCFGYARPAGAQEGFPLKGSWLGSWAHSQNHSDDVIVILNWDGKSITGTINPGTDNLTVKNASLNPEGWLVHFEADAKDKSGNPITYVVDGKIENLPNHDRSVVGTWKTKTESGPFKISRQ
jgi:hypothetical protein